MIRIKSDEEIAKMQEAGKLVAGAFREVSKVIGAGVTTEKLDRIAREFICDNGGSTPCLNYMGYPKSICTSVNDQIVHGIPGKYVIKDGDIVSCDIVAELKGWNGDATRTYMIGEVDEKTKQLVKLTEECFYEGLKFARVGYRVSDISKAIQNYAESNGLGVVRGFIGHGIGSSMHESPEVPNYYDPRQGKGIRLCKGLALAIEPMITLGSPDFKVLSDGWTAVTRDGKPCSHYENTVIITDGDPLITTQ